MSLRNTGGIVKILKTEEKGMERITRRNMDYCSAVVRTMESQLKEPGFKSCAAV